MASSKDSDFRSTNCQDCSSGSDSRSSRQLPGNTDRDFCNIRFPDNSDHCSRGLRPPLDNRSMGRGCRSTGPHRRSTDYCCRNKHWADCSMDRWIGNRPRHRRRSRGCAACSRGSGCRSTHRSGRSRDHSTRNRGLNSHSMGRCTAAEEEGPRSRNNPRRRPRPRAPGHAVNRNAEEDRHPPRTAGMRMPRWGCRLANRPRPTGRTP